jgi:hypothetical protein
MAAPAAYQAFARQLLIIDPDISSAGFIEQCITHVSWKTFGLDPQLVRFITTANLFPGLCIVPMDILIGTDAVSSPNSSEAFEAMRGWGVTPQDMKIMNEVGGGIMPVLSLSGLELCTPHCPRLTQALEHAALVLKTHDEAFQEEGFN